MLFRSDVLIKDVTFIGTNPDIAYSDAGVVTMGSYASGESPEDIYNVTFHNCVIANNLGDGGADDYEGVNGVKVYHGREGERFGDWTFSDCSFGTPNSPNGAFRRGSIELGEPWAGLDYYTDEPTPNYLQNIRLTGCDFEPCAWHCGYSNFIYGNGPLDRRQMLDNCTFKGNAGVSSWNYVNGLELQCQGYYIEDCEFWGGAHLWLNLEGDTFPGDEPSYNVFRGCNFDFSHRYGANGPTEDRWSCLIMATDWQGVVFDDCDICVGDATYYRQSLTWASDADTCEGVDYSTSYIHGFMDFEPTSGETVTSFWQCFTDWIDQSASAAESRLSDNDYGVPTIGTRP